MRMSARFTTHVLLFRHKHTSHIMHDETHSFNVIPSPAVNLPVLVIYNGIPYLITWCDNLLVIPHTVSATVIIEIATRRTKEPSNYPSITVSDLCEPHRFQSICKIHNHLGFQFELIFFPVSSLVLLCNAFVPRNIVIALSLVCTPCGQFPISLQATQLHT